MSVRVPAQVRRRIREEHAAVRGAAYLLGLITHAANHQRDPMGQPLRDSLPRAHDRRPRGRQGPRACRTERPPQLGGHCMVYVNGQWMCTICRRRSATRAAMTSRRCPGSAAATWAKLALRAAQAEDARAHRMVSTCGIIWCIACGSYAEHWAVGLTRGCPGPPPRSSCRQTALARLRSGRHPKLGTRLRGSPCLEHWSCEVHRDLSELAAAAVVEAASQQHRVEQRWRQERQAQQRLGGLHEQCARPPPAGTGGGGDARTAAGKKLDALRLRVRERERARLAHGCEGGGAGGDRLGPGDVLDHGGGAECPADEGAGQLAAAGDEGSAAKRRRVAADAGGGGGSSCGGTSSTNQTTGAPSGSVGVAVQNFSGEDQACAPNEYRPTLPPVSPRQVSMGVRAEGAESDFKRRRVCLPPPSMPSSSSNARLPEVVSSAAKRRRRT